jgi:hypothetical protein
MQRAFILVWTTTMAVVGLMVLLYVSLLPHFIDIGDWFVWVLRLAMICGSILMIAFTWFKIKSMHNYSQFTRHGEVVSYIGKTQPHVVSAIHEQAKIPRLLPAPADEPTFQVDEQDIINIYNANKEITLKDLAKQFDMTYNKVQKIYSEAKKAGLITRK